MNSTVNVIGQAAAALAAELSALRRELHQDPELSLQEHRTAAMIAELLTNAGCEVFQNVGGTGVVGILRNGGESPVVALRADMDALPITEETGCNYTSKNPGVMHACGHDAHMACLIGAMQILAQHRDCWHGTVKAIFQPAEEIVVGAKAMIQEAVMENPKVDWIFGLHVQPDLEAGKVGVKEGPLMAAADVFSIKIKGRGGHGAYPHLVRDPITGAAAVIMSLQTLISRSRNPLEPGVLSFGTVHGGTQNNIIPEEVELTGSVRTYDALLRVDMESWLRRTVSGTVEALGLTAEIDYIRGVIPVSNHPEAARIAINAVHNAVGTKALAAAVPVMGSEDFALLLEQAPGCFMWLGIRNEEDGIDQPWHSPRFDLDERALSIGAAVLAQCVAEACNYQVKLKEYGRFGR